MYMFLDVLLARERALKTSETDLFIKFDPRKVSLGVCVLETKEPHFPKSDCLNNLVEKLLPCCGMLDRELELRVHRGHPDIHLQGKKACKNESEKLSMYRSLFRQS